MSSPRTIGPYVLRDRIGTGGMGEVYRADGPNGRDIAVKVLKPEVADHPEVRRRFTREARASARLEHPHIVQLLDFGVDRGEHFFAMELVEGDALARWRTAPPDGETVLQVVDQVLRALAHAHARGVIHRDLKPENVLLSFDSDGHPCAKVMDFGVVFFRDERDFDIHGVQAVVGTPAYMAPEQGLNLCDASPATDLYALGVMLFEFVTGGRPFKAESTAATVVAHLKDPIPPMLCRPGFSANGDLERWVRRLLAKDPADRFLFASDAREGLRAGTLTGAAIGPSVAPSAARPASSTRGETAEHTVLRTVVRPLGSIVSLEPEPTAAFRLFGLRDPAFVGRDALIDTLEACCLRAPERRGVTLIIGEMGAGKSRVLRHLRERLEEPARMQVWTGVYDDRPSGPDVGLRQALRRGLGVAGLTDAELLARVEKLHARVGVDDPWESEALAEFLCGDREGDGLLDDADAAFAVVDRALRRASATCRVLLVLDDLHAGASEAGAFLRWLAAQDPSDTPYAVVLAVRPAAIGADTALGAALATLRAADPAVNEHVLPRLTRSEIGEIVRACVPVEPAIVDALAVRSGGNALVAVELLRHLVDSGRLEGIGPTPTAEEVLVDVPEAVGDLVDKRIADAASGPGSDANTHAIWTRLAFLGLRFPVALARMALADDASSLDRALDAGLVAGILRAEVEDDTLSFESGLVRDALVAAAERAGVAGALHAAAGEHKAVYYRATLPARALEIARHFELAGASAPALTHYRLAISHGRAHHQMQRVLDAWRAVERLATDPTDGPALTVEAAVGQADALLQLARFDEASASAERALEMVGPRGAPRAARIIGDALRQTGELRAARLAYETLLAGLAADDAERAEVVLGLARLERRDGRLAYAERGFREAIALLDAQGRSRGVAGARRELAETALATGLLSEARALAVDALASHEARADRRGVALCERVLGDVARAEGALESAAAHYLRAVAGLRQVGDAHAAALAALAAASAEVARSPDAALAAIEAAAATLGRLGDAHGVALAEAQIAWLDADAGRWGAAEPRIRAALARDGVERIDDPAFTEALVEVGKLALMTGRETLSRALLEVAAYKLDRVADQSPLYRRVDEVQYLLAELGDGPLDGGDAVVDLFADEPD